jgi:UDP-2,3-diacylglucosamine pyrophosphatase LpxH
MLRKIVQFIFRKPMLYVATKYSGAPVRENVHKKLTEILKKINANKESVGKKIDINNASKIVIMSDLHKGVGNGADDFKTSEKTYIEACYHYLQNDFDYVALGDIEELWENSIVEVIAQNELSIAAEKEFVLKNKFYKVIGNHDMYWKSTPLLGNKWLAKMYDKVIPVYDGIVLQYNNTQLLLAHGHQGDSTSDGNKWSKWFVANIWSPAQAYLDINVNTPSKDFMLRDKHNKMMYDWSAEQKNTILITGHTHKPVFASMNHIDQLKKEIEIYTKQGNVLLVKKLQKELQKRLAEYIISEPFTLKKPSYFNTGCCCYNDGDITVIEITDGKIRLVKWCQKNNEAQPLILQELVLQSIIPDLA